jgi:hypothetical protein
MMTRMLGFLAGVCANAGAPANVTVASPSKPSPKLRQVFIFSSSSFFALHHWRFRTAPQIGRTTSPITWRCQTPSIAKSKLSAVYALAENLHHGRRRELFAVEVASGEPGVPVGASDRQRRTLDDDRKLAILFIMFSHNGRFRSVLHPP